ncbi:MAG: CoB--CoM heterodisulfide reductase iron-sulfur subunit A family protein [Desulfohalobiaceae bacterium]
MSNQQQNTLPGKRVGVFICDCGSNIAGHLDCKAVTEYASTLPGVALAKENLYTCSEAGVLEIKRAIQEHNLDRVVVASCSPRTHMPLFSSSCAEAGLNPYLFEMVNIRDQCSWVHMQEKEQATHKAMELVRMGVYKSKFLEPQLDIESSLVYRTLVIGGGLSGLTAAQSLADMGLEVVLVEKADKLGGLLNQLHRLAPEGDLAQDRVQDLAQQVQNHPKITVYTNTKVAKVDGYIGSYQVQLESGPGDSRQETVGCIAVATGAVPLIPQDGLLGYDADQVITQMELENRLQDQNFAPGRVVIIQCAGARDEHRPYCSRICCMTGVKNAMELKRRNPEAEIHVLYRDMQMFGTEKEKMLWEARGQGIQFQVYDPEKPPQVRPGHVDYQHALLGQELGVDCDLVVLSTPLVAREDAARISQMMRVPTDQNQFFLEAHAKLRPLDFAADGIFVCGSARYPATTEEAVAQGTGLAARVGTILFKEKLISSAIVAEINPETCVGCQGCLDVCPYQAIHFDPHSMICRVNEILCKGCGNCAATCPSQSAKLRGYKPEQLNSQIRALA